MITEKETIARILRGRGILKRDGTIDMVRFQKLVTEPWIHQKAKQYGFLDGTAANEVVEVPVAPATVEINETPAERPEPVEEVPAEEVKVEEPVTEEAPVVEVAPAAEPEPLEEAPVEEAPAEAPVEEAVEPAEEAVEEKVEEANAVEETAAPVEEAPAEAPVEAAPKKATKKSSKK